MYNGLWTVAFKTPIGFGYGIIVLNNGKLLGGDTGYYYTGKYTTDGGNFQGTLEVIRFENDCISVFGDIEELSLSISGSISEFEFTATASMQGSPELQMSVTGNKKETL